MSQMPDPAPVPTPVPVQPLSYATPSRTGRSGRPGLVTAMGVTSICFGAWGVLSYLWQAISPILIHLLTTSSSFRAFGIAGTTTGPSVELAANAMAVVGLANTAAAVFLLVIGIMVVRDSSRGGDLHRLYAWIKIALAILGGGVYAWWFSQLLSSVGASAPSAPAGAGSPGSFTTRMLLVTATFQALLGCIYPVALLIALRTRTFREYYGSIRPESAATDPPTG